MIKDITRRNEKRRVFRVFAKVHTFNFEFLN